MSRKPAKTSADRQARAAALREQAQRAERRRRRLIALAVSVGVLAVVAGITIALTRDSIGGLKTGGDNEFRAYVNGKEYVGNPAAIEFRSHDQIAFMYGPTGQKTDVPSSYDWQEGE